MEGRGGKVPNGAGEWTRPGGRGHDALRCLSILIARHLWDEVVVPSERRRGRGAAGEEERLDWVTAAVLETEALMRRDLPLTLKALARHFEG
jgi:hypothetical protein